MDKIFKILADIRTPLALSGVVAGILFFVVLEILKNKNLSQSFLAGIINKLFLLSVIALLLGFSGWGYEMYRSSGIKTAVTFNILDSTGSHIPLDSINVCILGTGQEARQTDRAGFVVFPAIDLSALKDSLHIYFSSAKYGISRTIAYSLNPVPTLIYLPTAKRVTLTSAATEKNDDTIVNGSADQSFGAGGEDKKADSSVVVREPQDGMDAHFAANLKTLLYANLVLGTSTINDVIAFEFGEGSRNSLTYESLPVAGECTNNIVKYYWRPLKDSKQLQGISQFLSGHGLRDKITNDSYVIYVFYQARLSRIEIRFFSGDQDFFAELVAALGKKIDRDDQINIIKDGFYYVASTGVTNGWKDSHIMIMDAEGANECDNDWWNKLKK